MLRLIFIFILGYILYRLVKSVFGPEKKVNPGRNSDIIDEMVQDPVCQTYIPRRQAYNFFRNNREYFFCSRECAEKFKALKDNPDKKEE